MRRKLNRIHGLQLDDGTWIFEDSALQNEALRFYHNLFCVNEAVNLNALPITNHPKISDDGISTLLAPVLKEEVKVA